MNRRQLDELLVPGGGVAAFRESRSETLRSDADRLVYLLESSINSARRDRDAAQRRSTDREDVPSASAVSSVVRPAK